MSWEDKFSSIVRETESNLARVRDRLGSSTMPRTRTSSGKVSFASPTRDSSYFQTMSSLSHSMDNLPRTSIYGSQVKSSLSASKSFIDLGNSHRLSSSPTRASDVTGGNQSSPALVNLLYEKVEKQSEMLESLSKTVKTLEKERNIQADMISSLQSQVVKLNDRLREQGVDMETERKLEQFKREMYSYLQSLQTQYRMNERNDHGFHGDASSLAREIQDNKRQAHEDCESLRREIDHLKTRINKIEIETHATMADSRDSARRLERIDRTVTVLSENQRSQSHSLESMVDDRDIRSLELAGLRDKINDLSRQVSEWESDAQAQRLIGNHVRPLSGSSSSSVRQSRLPTKQSKSKAKAKTTTLMNGHGPTVGKIKPKTTTAAELDVSLSDSDLDISSALIPLDSDTESDLTSIQINTNSLKVDNNEEISDLSSSLSSLNSDELLGL